MLKAAGAAMVVLSAAAYAFYRLLLLRRRLETVRELRRVMVYISSYIGFSVLPLKELTEELIKKERGYVLPALEYFSSGLDKREEISVLWRESLGKLPLLKEDAEIFAPLGGCLGMTDRELQLKTADAAVREADMYEKRLMAQLEKFKSVDLKLMITGGIVVVVILL